MLSPASSRLLARTAAANGSGVQRLEVMVAVMLARERPAPTGAADGSAALIAASLAALPSRPLEMIAEAVAALGSLVRAACAHTRTRAHTLACTRTSTQAHTRACTC